MKRLFDDPAVPSDLRAELERSQRAGREYDVIGKLPRIRAAFDDPRPIAGEALEHALGSNVGRSGSAVSSLAPLAWKLVLLAAVGGVITYAAWPDAAPDEQPERPAVVARPVASVPVPEPTPVAEPPVTEPPATSPAVPEAEPRELASAAPRSDAATSRREIAQLVRIRALLESDPARAYLLARSGDREFPRGVLGEERRALRVMALAKSGEAAAAEQEAEDFYRRYPQSPMRRLVEAALR